MSMRFYEQIEQNQRKTFFLFFIYFLIFGIVAWIVGQIYGYNLSAVIIVLVLLQIITTWFWGPKIVLKIANAKKADKTKHKIFYDVVEEMCIAAGMPMPQLYVIENPGINACATGKNEKEAVICITTGALEKLNRAELQGVVAHELSHIKNKDILIGTMAAILTGALLIVSELFLRSMYYGRAYNRSYGGTHSYDVSDKKNSITLIIGILFMALVPVFAQIIKFSISRKREFLADASAVELTRYPDGLAGALEKIKKEGSKLPVSTATAHMFIANPLQKDFWSKMLSTHPPIDERIKRLKGLQ